MRSMDMPFSWVPPWQSGRPAWTEWSVEKAITEGYRAHGIVYICVRRLSACISSVPWLVKRMTLRGEETLPDHPAALLLAKPNPWASQQDVMEATTLDLNLGGNAYWLILRQGETAQELYRLRPDRVKPIPDAKTFVSGYEYTIGSQKTTLPVRDDAKGIAVVHFKLMDPGNDLLGLSPLQAASRVVDTDNAAIDWNVAALQNQARPAGALVAKEKLTQDEYDRLRLMLKEQITGAANARVPLLLEGGLTWQQHGFSPTDMDFLQGRKMSAVEICNIFGVRPEWVGLIEAKFENARQARRMTWEDTIIPFLDDLASTMGLSLAPLFDGDIFFATDLSKTPAITEARSELIGQAKDLWGMGVPFNAVNEELGLGFEPVQGGDVGYLPVMMMPVESEPKPAGEARITNADLLQALAAAGASSDELLATLNSMSATSDRVVNLTTEAQRTTYWRAFDRQRLAWEKGIAGKIKSRFGDEEKAVLKVVEGGSSEVSTIVTAQEGEWETLLLATWQAAFEHFGEQAAEAFGMEVKGRSAGPDQSRAVWDPWPAEAKAFVSQVVGEHVSEITTATKVALRREIQDALAANEGVPQIAARIRGLYDGYGRHRSFTIARTEVGGAANYGTRSAAQQSGVVQTHTWLSSRDERVRDSHRAIDGQTVALAARYSNGCLFPNDPGGPAAEVVQCRCVETFGTGG
ncbi:MAG TPA: phage portal protein [Anaerolineae bacterium]|nr:phage portal protein [Anaerolineae bacterium]